MVNWGGFAQGMSNAFQDALDREEREKERAEANARQLAGFAHQKKMYNLKKEDTYKEAMNSQIEMLRSYGITNDRHIAAILTTGETGVAKAGELYEAASPFGMDINSWLDVKLGENFTGEEFTDTNILSTTMEGLLKSKMEGTAFTPYLTHRWTKDAATAIPAHLKQDPAASWFEAMMDAKQNLDLLNWRKDQGMNIEPEEIEAMEKTWKHAEKEHYKEMALKHSDTDSGPSFLKAQHLNFLTNNVKETKRNMLQDIVDVGQGGNVARKIQGNWGTVLPAMEAFIVAQNRQLTNENPLNPTSIFSRMNPSEAMQIHNTKVNAVNAYGISDWNTLIRRRIEMAKLPNATESTKVKDMTQYVDEDGTFTKADVPEDVLAKLKIGDVVKIKDDDGRDIYVVYKGRKPNSRNKSGMTFYSELREINTLKVTDFSTTQPSENPVEF